MPVAASCTLVISAACHAPKNENDTHLRLVRWGVVEDQVVDGVGHCCFSAGPVKKPEMGMVYR
jgi:hypothetical protein